MSLQHNDEFAHVVQASHEALVITGDDGCIRFVNPAAEKLFARSVEGLLGRRLDLRAVESGQVIIHRGQAGDAYAEATAITTTWDARPAHLLWLKDVTALVHKQQRLRQAMKMEAIGQLTAGVAHDFNNKLTIINGFVGVALSQVGEDHPLFEALQEIARAADHSAKMVEQVLCLGRTQKTTPPPTRLTDMLTAMRASLGELLGEGIDLQVDHAGEAATVRVDPVQFEQAVHNLVVNARHAMDGRGTLTIRTDTVDVSADYAASCPDAVPGPHAVLSITDTGCGMDAATREQIFEPFFTTKVRGEGTGLGLAMVHGLMVQSEGHITVESAPGSGTTFHLFFPASAEAAHDTPTQVVGRFDDAHHHAGSATILLAEDETAIRHLLVRVLQTCGYRVLAGADGVEALDKADGLDGPLDLLITDVVMPNMCGRTLAERLRQQRPETKIIYISGYAQGVVDEVTIKQEGSQLIRKPFSPEHLIKAVQQALASPAAVAG